jgi:HAMP domain-containing protein
MDEEFEEVRFRVEAGDNTGILGIEVIGGEPETVLSAQDAYLAELHGQLIDRQREAGVDESLWVRDSVLTSSLSANARYGARDRSVAAVVLLGLIATVAAATFAESVRTRGIERRRRAATMVAALTSTDAPPADTTSESADDVLQRL